MCYVKLLRVTLFVVVTPQKLVSQSTVVSVLSSSRLYKKELRKQCSFFVSLYCRTKNRFCHNGYEVQHVTQKTAEKCF